MENWGLVVVSEKHLVFNPEVQMPRDQSVVTSVIAHELAHMVRNQTFFQIQKFGL